MIAEADKNQVNFFLYLKGVILDSSSKRKTTEPYSQNFQAQIRKIFVTLGLKITCIRSMYEWPSIFVVQLFVVLSIILKEHKLLLVCLRGVICESRHTLSLIKVRLQLFKYQYHKQCMLQEQRCENSSIINETKYICSMYRSRFCIKIITFDFKIILLIVCKITLEFIQALGQNIRKIIRKKSQISRNICEYC